MEEIQNIFESYIMERELKRGANSTVCLVRHAQTLQRCIYREFSGTPEVYRRLRGVESANLPKILDVREEGDRVFVLEEYVPGDTLEFLLEEGPLTPEQTRQIALQLCDALNLLHGFDIIHRDIKPENIILRGDEAVLLDFDASRIVKPGSCADTRIMGTTGYAAPEQFGFSQTDARADIYAVGVLINEMLTNRHPSQFLTDSGFRTVIEKCIEVNVDKRYRSVAQLQTAIRGIRLRKRRRWAAWLLAAAAALCVAGAVCIGGTAEPAEQDLSVITPEVWPGEQRLYQAPFLYDLDGDGETEEYRFGIYHEDIPREFGWTLTDQFWLNGEPAVERNVAPAVWRENTDGTWELMEEFAPLLEDVRLRVWRGTEQTGAVPEIYDRESVWKGAVCLVFEQACLGTWLYELHATLEGQELSALCRSTMIEG